MSAPSTAGGPWACLCNPPIIQPLCSYCVSGVGPGRATEKARAVSSPSTALHRDSCCQTNVYGSADVSPTGLRVRGFVAFIPVFSQPARWVCPRNPASLSLFFPGDKELRLDKWQELCLLSPVAVLGLRTSASLTPKWALPSSQCEDQTKGASFRPFAPHPFVHPCRLLRKAYLRPWFHC